MGEFEKRAKAGDGEFRDVLEEMRTREDLRESRCDEGGEEVFSRGGFLGHGS